MQKKDELGKRYGSLVVIKEADEVEASNKCIKWICVCDCGNVTVVNGNNLRFGHTKSCGKCRK